MRHSVVMGVVALFCLAVTVPMAAQESAPKPPKPSASEDVDQLEQQIRALQSQLDSQRTEAFRQKRITEISREVGAKSDEVRMVVRIYDLSDLFTLAPPYPAGQGTDLTDGEEPIFSSTAMQISGGGMSMGGGMGGGAGFFNVPNRPKTLPSSSPRTVAQVSAGTVGSAETRTSIDDLINVIQTTISPTEWDSVGGNGSIAALGTALVVSATETSHNQIEALFGAFRERWGSLQSVTLQAHWLWLDEADLDQLLVKPKDQAALGVTVSFVGMVDEEAFVALTRKPLEDRPAGYRSIVTCYNGQTVYNASGTQRMVVSGIKPVQAKDEKGNVKQIVEVPEFRPLQEGAVLQLTPLVSTSGSYIAIDVHGRVILPTESEKQADAPNVPLNLPVVKHCRIETTVRMPVGRRMLVGGSTFEAPTDGGSDLYLFLKASVQELRDDIEQTSDEK